MREIKLSAALQQGEVVWTASAVSDGDVQYSSMNTPKTAIDALMLLTQQLYARVHDLEARPLEHYGA
jgi:hypothetical protein